MLSMSIMNQVLFDYSRISPEVNGVVKYLMRDTNEDVVLTVCNDDKAGAAIALSQNAKLVVCLCTSVEQAGDVKNRCQILSIENIVPVVALVTDIPFDSIFNCVFIHAFNPAMWLGDSGLFLKEKQEKFKVEIDRAVCQSGYLYLSKRLMWCDKFFRGLLGKIFGIEMRGWVSKSFTRKFSVYHYKGFNCPSFMRFVSASMPFDYRGAIFGLKRRLWGDNIGAVFTKGADSADSILISIKCQLEASLDVFLSNPHMIRNGSGGSYVVEFGDVIVRLPVTGQGGNRCAHNFMILNLLLKCACELDVPKPLGTGYINGNNYYAESRVNGLSLDLNELSPESDKLVFRQAVKILQKFSLGRYLDSSEISNVVEKEFSLLIEYIPHEYVYKFEKLQEHVLNVFDIDKLTAVIQHGDFKQSNFLVAENNVEIITGLIDWDMASIPGLPLLDLLTLLFYQKEGSATYYYEGVWEIVNNPNDTESKLIDEYCSLLGITSNSKKMLGVCAIIWIVNNFFSDEVKKDSAWSKEVMKNFILPIIDETQGCIGV